MYRRQSGRIAGFLVLLAGLGATAPTAAHPHVWVEARAKIIFDTKARVRGIRQTWIFDPAYSAYPSMGLDMDRDGRPDQVKLTELADENLAALAEANYLITMEVDGSPAALASPSSTEASVVDDRLVLRLRRPLKSPIKPKRLVLHVGDPTFFTAFTPPQAADPTVLDGVPEACKASLMQPVESGSEDVKRLAQDISAALRGELAVPATGDNDPAGRSTLVCQQE